MQQPLVSVIVPAYNQAAYLRQRLQSIRIQKGAAVELILLDDASTDGSAAILQKFIDSDGSFAHSTTMLVNDTNSGSPIRQWLKGLSVAKADWVWIAEGDDVAAPEFLSAFTAALASNPSMALFASASIQSDETTGKEEKILLPYLSGLVNGREFFSEQMMVRNALPNASAVVFNRRLVEDKEWVSIAAKTWVGDWELWNTLLLKGNLYYDSRALNLFRRPPVAASRKWYDQGFHFREGLPMVRRHLHQLNPNIKTRLKFWLRWSDRLRQHYNEQSKPGIATTAFTGGWKHWLVLHGFLPFTWLRGR